MENCYLYVTLPICQFDGEKSKNLKKNSDPRHSSVMWGQLRTLPPKGSFCLILLMNWP